MPHTIEYPTQERLTELWPQIQPLFQRCCEEAADGEIDAEDIRALHAMGGAHVFVELEEGVVTVAMAIEFIHYPKFKAANVFALGGHGLRQAKNRFWPLVVEWLKANEVKSVDAWVSDGMMKLLNRMLGFKKVYNHTRLMLE